MHFTFTTYKFLLDPMGLNITMVFNNFTQTRSVTCESTPVVFWNICQSKFFFFFFLFFSVCLFVFTVCKFVSLFLFVFFLFVSLFIFFCVCYFLWVFVFLFVLFFVCVLACLFVWVFGTISFIWFCSRRKTLCCLWLRMWIKYFDGG